MNVQTLAKKATGAKLPGTNVRLTGGWYVFLGCGAAVLVSDTRAAPIAAGLLGVALIFQLDHLLKGN